MNLRILFISIFLISTFFISCDILDPDEDEKIISDSGSVIFWIREDMNMTIDVYIDNQFTGQIDGYYPDGPPSCGSEYGVTKELQNGLHSLRAVTQSGLEYTGDFLIEGETCVAIELLFSNFSGGGGSGGGGNYTHTAVSTFFIAGQNNNLINYDDSWLREFTINSATTFVLYFAARYSADCAIITSDQVNNFKNNNSFTGYASFDNQFGYKLLTLNPGTYYLAIRNQSNSSNEVSVELDYDIALPASDKCTFYDQYINSVKTVSSGSKTYQKFTVQSDFRYYLDGCNTGIDSYVIPESELSNFLNNNTFQYHSEYYSSDEGGPGLWEIELPPGSYYLTGVNTTDETQSIVYNMERWKQN